MPKYPPITFLLMFMLCLFTSEIVKGQGTMSYLATLKQKNYIPLPVNSSPTDFLLVGTEGNFEGDINIRRVDGSGNVVFDYLFRDPNHKKTVVDFTYMNIPGLGGDCYFITCLKRGNPAIIPWGDCDMIEIIGIDENGNILTNFCVGYPTGRSLTPVHTMEHYSTFLGGDYLYICGYLSAQTAIPLIDDNSTYKFAYVLMVDPLTQSIPGALGIENLLSNGSTLVNTNAYYDMAVRMIPTNDGDDDIFVTGCSNIIRETAIGSGIGVFTAGTLNMTVKSDLSTYVLPNRPLGKKYGYQEEGEFGQDMFILSSGEYLISGNDFRASGSTLPQAYNYHFTAVDPTTLPALLPIGTGNNARIADAGFDQAWGLQTLQTHTGYSDDFILGGMVRYGMPNCTIPLGWVTPNNYCPFTADYNFYISGTSLYANQNFVNLYPTNVGTGNWMLFNSYHQDQLWTFNNSWAPNFATQRYGTGQPLTLTAPFWNIPNSQLNNKIIIADEWGDANSGCSGTSVNCINSYPYHVPVTVCDNFYGTFSGVGPINYSINRYVAPLNPVALLDTLYSNSSSYYYPAYCDPFYWKQNNAHSDSITSVLKVDFSPNPAHDYINLNIIGKPKILQVWLTDMMGQKINTLFEGNIETTKIRVDLPELSTGLYFLNIKADNQLLPTQKISIY